jgi:hypothetical protein
MLQSSSLVMQSDARPELGDTSKVVTSTGVGKGDRSQDIRPKLYLLTGVGHATEVMHTIGVVIYLHYKHV